MIGRDEVTTGALKGRTVIDNQGATLGDVDDISIDPQNWRVTGLVVNLRREVADDLNLRKGWTGGARVQFGAERVQSIGDNVLLNLNTDEIAGILRRG